MKKLLCQGVRETHSRGFAETPWIQLVLFASLQYSLNSLWPCRAPAKSRSECTADCFPLASLHPHLRRLISHCVLLPLYPVLGTARKQLWKGLKTGPRLWLGPYCSCTHTSSQPPHSFQNIGNLVREKYVMHRGVIFPRVYKGGRKEKEQILILILIHVLNNRNMLKAQNTLKIPSPSVSTKNENFYLCSIFVAIPK